MDPPPDGAVPAGGDLPALLLRGFEEGRVAHGPLALPFEVFARRAEDLAARRLRAAGADPSPEETAALLSRAALADLFLASACEEGVAGAWERFVGAFERMIVALAVRRGASKAEAGELAREIPGELFAPPAGGGSRTRLGTFDGAGSLAAWLGVIVQRRLADRRRSADRTEPVPVADAPDPGSPDPADLAVDAETGRLLEEAFREAWADLTARETLVLLFRYRDGLPQTEIARVLGVGEPRVSRMLSVAAGKIRASVVRRIGRDPSAGDRDPDRAWAALERAVAGFLATPPPSPDPYAHG